MDYHFRLVAGAVTKLMCCGQSEVTMTYKVWCQYVKALQI